MDKTENILASIPGIARGKWHFLYDEVSDVLYSWKLKTKEVLTIESNGGVNLRVNPSTKELLGFTIVDCKARMNNNDIGYIPHIPKKRLLNLISPHCM